MYAWGAGWVWFWTILAVIALVIFVSAVGLWLRTRVSASRRSHDADSARRILDERFARGEIDEDEYRRRREHLR